jgi:hypothetical protein
LHCHRRPILFLLSELRTNIVFLFLFLQTVPRPFNLNSRVRARDNDGEAFRKIIILSKSHRQDGRADRDGIFSRENGVRVPYMDVSREPLTGRRTTTHDTMVLCGVIMCCSSIQRLQSNIRRTYNHCSTHQRSELRDGTEENSQTRTTQRMTINDHQEVKPRGSYLFFGVDDRSTGRLQRHRSGSPVRMI